MLAAAHRQRAASLSPTTVARLEDAWYQEYQSFAERSLADKRYVYLWVDGIYFNIRLEEDRQCMLVVIGATKDGRKELVAIADGYREGARSWKDILVDLKRRASPERTACHAGAPRRWSRCEHGCGRRRHAVRDADPARAVRRREHREYTARGAGVRSGGRVTLAGIGPAGRTRGRGLVVRAGVAAVGIVGRRDAARRVSSWRQGGRTAPGRARCQPGLPRRVRGPDDAARPESRA